MKTFRIITRIKNNRLQERREKFGFKNIKEFCEKANISYSSYVNLECMYISPVKKNWTNEQTMWTNMAIRLCDFYQCEPEELFPQEIEQVKKIKTEMTFDLIDLPTLQANNLVPQLPPSPFESTSNNELRDRISKVLSTLTQREQKILEMRFGLNGYDEHTLEEVSKEFDVTGPRIREIESKALRKIRHPSRSKILKSFESEGNWWK